MYKRLCTYVSLVAMTAGSLVSGGCTSNEIKKVEKRIAVHQIDIDTLKAGDVTEAEKVAGLEKIAAEVKGDVTKLQGQYGVVEENKKLTGENSEQIKDLQTGYAGLTAQINAMIETRKLEAIKGNSYDKGKRDGLNEAARLKTLIGK